MKPLGRLILASEDENEQLPQCQQGLLPCIFSSSSAVLHFSLTSLYPIGRSFCKRYRHFIGLSTTLTTFLHGELDLSSPFTEDFCRFFCRTLTGLAFRQLL